MNPVTGIFFYYTRTRSIRVTIVTKFVLGVFFLGFIACSIWSTLWLIKH